MEKLPIKISPCPIMEATVELRFDSDLPKGAIFGIIYNAVKDSFPKVEKLPAAMFLNISENDPNLKYKPLYKITDGVFNAQIGFDVVSFHSPTEYVGWKSFVKNIVPFFDKINQTGVIAKTESIALRYLNFFESDIYKDINLQILMLDKEFENRNLVMRTELPDGAFVKTLQIANNVSVKNALGHRKGSLLDITCALNKSENVFSDFEQTMDKAHQMEKELFFGLLKNDFLQTLKPEYDDE